jgi:hypothetical protein
LILHVSDLRVLLGIRLLLLCRFRSRMMAYCIGSTADHGGSHHRAAHNSSS